MNGSRKNRNRPHARHRGICVWDPSLGRDRRVLRDGVAPCWSHLHHHCDGQRRRLVPDALLQGLFGRGSHGWHPGEECTQSEGANSRTKHTISLRISVLLDALGTRLMNGRNVMALCCPSCPRCNHHILVAFIHDDGSKLPNPPLAHPRRQQVPFIIIDLLFATSYLRAIFTPPGAGSEVKSRRSRRDKDEWTKRCIDCCEQKPDRSHHCSQCKVGGACYMPLSSSNFPLAPNNAPLSSREAPGLAKWTKTSWKPLTNPSITRAEMRAADGPPLPMDQQLRRVQEPQVLLPHPRLRGGASPFPLHPPPPSLVQVCMFTPTPPQPGSSLHAHATPR
jgi:hypothetical protein